MTIEQEAISNEGLASGNDVAAAEDENVPSLEALTASIAAGKAEVPGEGDETDKPAAGEDGEDAEDDEGKSESEEEAEEDPDAEKEDGEGDSKEGESAGEDGEPEGDEAGDEVDDADIDPAVLSEVRQNIPQVIANVEKRIEASFQPRAAQNQQEYDRVQARIDAILAGAKEDEDGFERPLTATEQYELTQLTVQRNRLDAEADQIIQQTNSTKAEARVLAIAHANIQAFPRLKEYQDEVVAHLRAGYQPSNLLVFLELCKAERAAKEGRLGKKEPKAPQVSKQEVERKVLEDNIRRKQQGKVTAGKQAGGGLSKSAKPRDRYADVPDADARERLRAAYGD